MTKEKTSIEQKIKNAGLRATPKKIVILEALTQHHTPVSALELARELRKEVDQVTVYRALQAFDRVGLVRKINLQRDEVFYEYVLSEEHHHHVVCETCGAIEDVHISEHEALEVDALSHTKKFSKISYHSLEFFGVCMKCSL